MYFFTHLYIARELHRQLSKNILLDYNAFSYGNIKPDIPSKTRQHHTQENYLEQVIYQVSILKNQEFTVHEFSVKLGEICHYFSDFFCYYHLNEHLHKKNLNHFFYEISMHISLINYKFNKINFKDSLDFLESPDSSVYPVYPYFSNYPTTTFEDLITSSFTTMFELYSKRPNSMKKDMDFALSTSLIMCEKILEGVHFTSSIPYNFDLMANSTNLKEEQLL